MKFSLALMALSIAVWVQVRVLGPGPDPADDGGRAVAAGPHRTTDSGLRGPSSPRTPVERRSGPARAEVPTPPGGVAAPRGQRRSARPQRAVVKDAIDRLIDEAIEKASRKRGGLAAPERLRSPPRQRADPLANALEVMMNAAAPAAPRIEARPTRPQVAGKPDLAFFVKRVAPLLQSSCVQCHGRKDLPVGKLFLQGGKGFFTARKNFQLVQPFLDPVDPARSALITKVTDEASGVEHGGGKPFARASGEYLALLDFARGVSYSAPPPVAAIAALPREVEVQTALSLDGTRSRVEGGGRLSYRWRLREAPADARARIGRPGSPRSEFVPDRPGVFVIELEVAAGRRRTVQPAAAIVQVVERGRSGPVTSRLDFWRGWIAGELAHLRLTGPFAPSSRWIDALAIRLANRRVEVPEAFRALAGGAAFERRYPAAGDQVATLFVRLLGRALDLRRDAALLDAASRMCRGQPVEAFGRRGRSLADLVRILIEQGDFWPLYLRRLRRRGAGAGPGPALIDRWGTEARSDPTVLRKAIAALAPARKGTGRRSP